MDFVTCSLEVNLSLPHPYLQPNVHVLHYNLWPSLQFSQVNQNEDFVPLRKQKFMNNRAEQQWTASEMDAGQKCINAPCLLNLARRKFARIEI